MSDMGQQTTQAKTSINVSFKGIKNRQCRSQFSLKQIQEK